MLNYSVLPVSARGGMRRYIENRIEPGFFLRAVLENDLVGAFGAADEDNREDMSLYASFLYKELPGRGPGSPWGSREAVEAWLHPPGVKQEEQEEQEAE